MVIQPNILMDILFPVARISIIRSSYNSSFPFPPTTSPLSSDPSSSSPCSPSSSFRTRCSRGSSQQPSDGADNGENEKDEKSSMDWDKAWSNFRKQGKKRSKRPSSQFSPNKYVTWNPRRSNYPISEEVDPIKRTERSNLMLWTSPRFTLGGAIVIVSLLLVYTLLAPMK